MKKILILFLLICSLTASAATYYVATTGNDGAAGTPAAPWATWQKGFSTIIAGDTLYIRGGTYQPAGTLNNTSWINWYGGVCLNGKDGTAVDRIVVMNYPGETPILDGTNITQGSGTDARAGIFMRDCEYWTIKGLTVTGVVQSIGHLGVVGIRIQEDVKHFVFERIISHDNDGSGISFVYDCDDNLILNCDSYNNIDPLSTSPYDNSDGIEIAEVTSTSMVNTVRGCRMWGNCDDGMDLFDNDGVVIIDNCWAFDNVKPASPSDANGFKLGRTNNTHGTVRRILTNCIASGNQADGIATGGDAYCDMDIYNCIAVNNHYGFHFYLTTSTDCGTITVRNNVAYGNTDNFRHKYAPMVVDHNSYDSDFESTGPVASAIDFVAVDSAALYTVRQSDGSLPVLTYLHLTPGSNLIGVGTTVLTATDGDGETWNAPPSLGAFEYKGTPTPPADARYVVDNGKYQMYGGKLVIKR